MAVQEAVDALAMDVEIAPGDKAAAELAQMRHSCAHLMAEAVQELYPGVRFAIGPAIDNGFYYDMDLSRALTPDDLASIEARMCEHQAAAEPFVREVVSRDKALELFANNTYKVEIIKELPASEEISTYQQGAFLDLCRGPHVATTADIGAFKLTSVAGAYWRGDEKRPMLQRIYGTAWPTQEELDDYLHRLEEAHRRDHRRLGKELDLFSVNDEIGAGLLL